MPASLTTAPLPSAVAARGGVRVAATSKAARPLPAAFSISCNQEKQEKEERKPSNRREFVLNSTSALVLGSVFSFSGDRPRTLGVKSYGDTVKVLGLCPKSPNCVSTAEEANDPAHYIPAWSYDLGGRKGKSKDTAMAELAEVVAASSPDGFTPKIVKQTDDYLYAEFQSPIFGFVDDVEFYFPGDKENSVEYRSASRIGESDGNINRKRIKELRVALQKKGWKSKGF